MDATEQAAEQIVRMALAGSEVALRITGAGAKNVAAALMATAASQEKTKGKTRLAAMLKAGKALKVFPLPGHRLQEFAAEAKRYGVLYVVVKQDGGASVDLLVKAEDASKVNRIVERLGLGRLPDAPEAAQDGAGDGPIEPAFADAREEADGLLAELLAAPGETDAPPAPLASSPTERGKRPSGPTSGKAPASEGAGRSQAREKGATPRPSVRAEMRALKRKRAHAVAAAPQNARDAKAGKDKAAKGR